MINYMKKKIISLIWALLTGAVMIVAANSTSIINSTTSGSIAGIQTN
jgi:hypothetical protein